LKLNPIHFQLSITVQPEDIDQANHVNNVVYLRWVQDVSEGHWLAVATPEMRDNYFWVAIRHEIDYKNQGFLGDELYLNTYLKEYGGVRSKRAVQIIRKSDNKLLVESLTTWILMSAITNKPARIPDDMIKLFPLMAEN
jgi:acyl-CoA thioester hydrolase